MYDEDDSGEFETPARRFRPIDVVVMLLELPHRLFGSLAEWFEDVTILAASHANWKLQQESPIGVTA